MKIVILIGADWRSRLPRTLADLSDGDLLMVAARTTERTVRAAIRQERPDLQLLVQVTPRSTNTIRIEAQS